MRPLVDRTPILGHAMPDRHGVHAPTLWFVGAADLTEQAKCFRDLERETGPPAYCFPR